MDGNEADHKHERNTAMDKLIITLAVAALTLGAFAQENDSTAERGRSHERGRMQGRGRSRERGRMQANPDA